MDREQLIAHLTLHGVLLLVHHMETARLPSRPAALRLRLVHSSSDVQLLWDGQWRMTWGGAIGLYREVDWSAFTQDMADLLPESAVSMLNRGAAPWTVNK